MEVASRPVLWMFGNSWAKVLKLSTHGICWSTQILSQVIQVLQVNLCQKLSFFCIYYRIHNMASDCSLDYKEKQVQHMLCTQIVFNVKTQDVLSLYYSGNSKKNLMSYHGLIDARMRASDKDLPVSVCVWFWWVFNNALFLIKLFSFNSRFN